MTEPQLTPTDAAARTVELEARLADAERENARLFNELQERNREVTDALDHQKATGEVLDLISRAPVDLQPVLDTIVVRAAHLCGAPSAFIRLVRDGDLEWAAEHRLVTSETEVTPIPIDRSHPSGHAVLERRTVHVTGQIDDFEREYPPAGRFIRQQGWSEATGLAVPFISGDVVVGVVVVSRPDALGFTRAQIGVVETFADQAVIAIENARLFNELQDRNREVTEALEQQTATADVLGVISRSPTDAGAVLPAIAKAAERLCEADSTVLFHFDGSRTRVFNTRGQLNEFESDLDFAAPAGSVAGKVLETRGLVHVHGQRAAVAIEYPFLGRPEVAHLPEVSALGVPLLRAGEPIGALVLVRDQDRHFTDKQISLLRTFAAQAVIAIENARLFNELQDRNREVTEALDRQTATSNVLETISRSPTDLQSVLDAIVRNAVALMEAHRAGFLRVGESAYEFVADTGEAAATPHPTLEAPGQRIPFHESDAFDEAVRERRTVHLFGGADAIDPDYPLFAAGWRERGSSAGLIVPVTTDGSVLGILGVTKASPEPYLPAQIELLETFGRQAAIAIENARLFNELQDRTRELHESNAHLEQRVAEKVREVERLSLMQRFVPPQLAEVIESGGAELLKSHRQEITVLFCDLRGWTPFTETAEPEDIMSVLAELHDALGPLVFEHGGTLVQFTGDGMMVLFNDPIPCEEPAWRAVQLAVRMRQRASGLEGAWKRHGYDLRFAVGVAIGYATCGQIGFEGRYEYTAIGTVTNLASRLCGGAAGGQILVQERVFALVEDRVHAEPAGDLTLKGLARPVTTYSVTGLR